MHTDTHNHDSCSTSIRDIVNVVCLPFCPESIVIWKENPNNSLKNDVSYQNYSPLGRCPHWGTSCVVVISVIPFNFQWSFHLLCNSFQSHPWLSSPPFLPSPFLIPPRSNTPAVAPSHTRPHFCEQSLANLGGLMCCFSLVMKPDGWERKHS